MITAIEIENFKGFSDRQRIELAPITLLYGQNSCGKSSVFKALFLLRNLLLEWKRLRDDEIFDVGSFRDYVHQHDLSRVVRIRLEVDTSSWLGDSVGTGDGGEFFFGSLPFCVEFGLSSEDGVSTYCSEFTLTVDGKSMLQYTIAQDASVQNIVFRTSLGNLNNWLYELSHWNLVESKETHLKLPTTVGLLSRFEVDLEETDFADGFDEEFSDSEIRSLLIESENAISGVYEGVLRYLRLCIEKLVYVGPLREIPKEVNWEQQVRKSNTWSNGLLAWKKLSPPRISKDLLNQTNRWLKQLNIKAILEDHRFSIRVRPFGMDPTVEGVRVQDVGTGISQVVPLIVALCLRENKAVLFEQPELHLNPLTQLGLADLLIETCVERRPHETQAIIETHSECLIHRLKRRVRESYRNVEAEEASSKLYPGRIAIYYFRTMEQGQIRVDRINLDVEGEFIEPWPDDFFDLDFNERFA
jgi:predicted ATPase